MLSTGEVNNRIAAAGYSKNYTPLYLSTRERESHFLFNPVETLLSTTYGGVGVASATQINLTPAFPHNKSMLKYNANTMTYDYYEYGSLHTDGEDGQALTFKNGYSAGDFFFTAGCTGYLIYNAIGIWPSTTATGYYFTDGQVIPITWYKNGETAITKYYDYTGQEIKLNLGKTYIGLIPSDAWTAIGDWDKQGKKWTWLTSSLFLYVYSIKSAKIYIFRTFTSAESLECWGLL